MTKGFQLLDNFMLLITTESPDNRYILSRVPPGRRKQVFSQLEEEKMLQMSIVFSQTP